MLRRVLFPAPEGPKIAVILPELHFPLMFLRINFEPGKKMVS